MLWRLWGPLTWLYYRGWSANTGPNTCYGDFGGIITWLYYRGWPANTGNTCYGDFEVMDLIDFCDVIYIYLLELGRSVLGVLHMHE